MTPVSRKLPLFLLFLNASPLLHPQLFTQAASTSRPITRQKINYLSVSDSDNDYDDNDNDKDYSSASKVISATKTTILQKAPKLCQYDSCSEKQEPCSNISARTGCLCPGISPANKLPNAPRINALMPINEGKDRGKVEIQWCAPSSVVTKYVVVIEGSGENTLEFQAFSRRGLVSSLEAGVKVCVQAVNDAGHSIASAFSCQRYDPPNNSDHNWLAGLIGGGVALLVLLIIVPIIVWRYQMSQKAKRDSADGLGNPSYSKEGTL